MVGVEGVGEASSHARASTPPLSRPTLLRKASSACSWPTYSRRASASRCSTATASCAALCSARSPASWAPAEASPAARASSWEVRRLAEAAVAACAAGAAACRPPSAARARSSSGRQSRPSAPASAGTATVSCGAARSHSARHAAASSWGTWGWCAEGCQPSGCAATVLPRLTNLDEWQLTSSLRLPPPAGAARGAAAAPAGLAPGGPKRSEAGRPDIGAARGCKGCRERTVNPAAGFATAAELTAASGLGCNWGAEGCRHEVASNARTLHAEPSTPWPRARPPQSGNA